MFNIKSLIIVFSVIVITIVHYGLTTKTAAEEECEELLAEELFENENPNGRLNFQKSFRTLTYISIYTHFTLQKMKRKLQRRLHICYYYDLYNNHGMNLEYDLKIMPVWCRDRVKDELKAEGRRNNYELLTLRFENCIKLIKDVFGIEGRTKPSKIFESFYEHWTERDLLNISEDGSSSSQTYTNANRQSIGVNNYPLLFFQYYEETVSGGRFRTIEEFCSHIGHEIVTSFYSPLV